jgi:hypothetical protein
MYEVTRSFIEHAHEFLNPNGKMREAHYRISNRNEKRRKVLDMNVLLEARLPDWLDLAARLQDSYFVLSR